MENKYRKTIPPINSKLMAVQNSDYKWGVINETGNVIVPFGKYSWIDGFQNGLAKVIGYGDTGSPDIIAVIDEDGSVSGKDIQRTFRQGIINERGEEVLPLEYNVWKFYGKNFPTIKYFKRDEEHTVGYAVLNPELLNDATQMVGGRIRHHNHCWDSDDDYDYRQDSWDAMTDGQYGDMPDGFDGDYDFLGY